MIISFVWTTPALLAGAKRVTRRDWTAAHAAKFGVGDLVDAWDRGPRTGRGRKVATIRITTRPYPEWTAAIAEAEWDREGFAYLFARGASKAALAVAIWREWHDSPRWLYVVRFELVDVARSSAGSESEYRGGGDVLEDSALPLHTGDGGTELAEVRAAGLRSSAVEHWPGKPEDARPNRAASAAWTIEGIGDVDQGSPIGESALPRSAREDEA